MWHNAPALNPMRAFQKRASLAEGNLSKVGGRDTDTGPPLFSFKANFHHHLSPPLHTETNGLFTKVHIKLDFPPFIFDEFCFDVFRHKRTGFQLSIKSPILDREKRWVHFYGQLKYSNNMEIFHRKSFPSWGGEKGAYSFHWTRSKCLLSTKNSIPPRIPHWVWIQIAEAGKRHLPKLPRLRQPTRACYSAFHFLVFDYHWKTKQGIPGL